MKCFLSICCLILCVGLSISAVSPEFHSLFFHSNETCPHSEGSGPFHSHEDEEEKQSDEQGSCPVLLFSKSSQISHIPIFLLLLASCCCCDGIKQSISSSELQFFVILSPQQLTPSGPASQHPSTTTTLRTS